LALNFNPWAKFQTFRHLPPVLLWSIPTLVELWTKGDRQTYVRVQSVVGPSTVA